MPTYFSLGERVPDAQYRDLILRIVNEGERVTTRQGDSYVLMQQTLRYPLSNGFPLIPDRSLEGIWPKAIGELCAFINGATTLQELERFGCDWWGPWATAEKSLKRGLAPGELGPGSYGAAFRAFPTLNGGFDQFAELVKQIEADPELRTHFVTPWIPQYQFRTGPETRKTTISPCHGWIHVRILNGQLHLHLYQRAADVPIGLPQNIVQYAALMLMLESLTGYTADTYYHTISDAHVYTNQLDSLDDLTYREPREFPKLLLNESGRSIRDIHDFRAEHFELSEYDPYPKLTFPVSP